MAASVPVGAAATVYARFPGRANDGLLDFNLEKHMKFFSRATIGLTTKYDCSSSGLAVFLQKVKERILIFNFTSILQVPSGDTIPIMRDLIQSYGLITIEECQAFAITYLAAKDRRGQNSGMLYQFLSDSLTDAASAMMLTQMEKYTINGEQDGMCFLKIIIAKAHVDTMASVNALRTSLSNLDHKMKECKGNILDFHQYVHQVINMLSAYAQHHDELLINLFKAYDMVEDEEFRGYIRTKRHNLEDSRIGLNDLALMSSVENHYNMRLEAGTWKAVDKKTERIIAMEAEINQLRNGGSGTKGKKAKDKAQNDAKWAWKKVPPKEGDPKQIVHPNGNTYHWCPNHGWSIHTPEKCWGKGKRADGSSVVNASVTNTPSTITPSPIVQPQLKLDPALATTTSWTSEMIP